MPESALPEGTLPSLDVLLPQSSGQPQLLLTLAFHPDTERIGEAVRLPPGRHPVGRDRPGFAAAHPAAPEALHNRYVSRRTLVLDYDGQRLRVERQPGACRCRLAGAELAGNREVPLEDLQRGMPLMISHAVLLWVSLAPADDGRVTPPEFGLVGDSPYLRSLRRQIDAAARSDLDVLLLGPTGSGKDRVARALHDFSGRRHEPLVAVNVAAVPAALAPAALFGAARGAYTGADRAQQGYFQRANGGTLFLDEIGDAPAEIQPQLLRALQQREIQVLGGAPQRVNVRVIAATDASIDEQQSGFKSALRHRLGALEIHLQGLRDHPEDIGTLLHHFLVEAFQREGRAHLLPGDGSSARELSAWSALFHACLAYDWPGNVRELINLCNQLAVASDTGLTLPPTVLARLGQGPELPAPGGNPGQAPTSGPDSRLRRIVEVPEEEFARAWHDLGREVRPVARKLGVSRQAVYRKVAGSDRYRLASDVPEAELRGALRQCGGDPVAAAQLLQVSSSGLKVRLRQGPGALQG